MKKLIALLMAAVMAIGMMVPGMAEPSPGKLDTQAVSYEIPQDVQEKLDAQGQSVGVQKANPAAYKNPTVAALVSKVNNVSAATATTVDAAGSKTETAVTTETTTNADGTKTTVTTTIKTESDGTVTATTTETTEDNNAATTVKDVVEALAELPANGDLELPDDLDNYDFVSDFNDLSVSDNAGVVYDDAGQAIEITVTLQDDALTDLDGDSDLNNYLVMLINPATGEICFLPLEKDENGNVVVKFPFLGVFAIIQKV